MAASRLRLLFVSLLAVAAASVLPAASAVASPAVSAQTLVRELRQTRSTLLGVSTEASSNGVALVNRFESDVGKPAGIVNVFVSFASPAFDIALVEQLSRGGALPMVTWLPCRDGSLGAKQPEFSLRRTVGGAFDSYIRAWAAGAARWGRPLLLRFAPEMNGTWNPWSAGVNGNTARDYVAAWRHVHDLFRQAGASNVAWVWSPTVLYRGSGRLAPLYPGDAYVDWIGIDGYNWGTSQLSSRWQTFDGVFRATLAAVRRLTHKPLMLAEVASSELGGDKAAWIRGFFTGLRRNPDILAFVWFNFDKETDWRVGSSERSRRAFQAGAAAPRIRGGAN
jgi:hypothetical protein